MNDRRLRISRETAVLVNNAEQSVARPLRFGGTSRNPFRGIRGTSIIGYSSPNRRKYVSYICRDDMIHDINVTLSFNSYCYPGDVV